MDVNIQKCQNCGSRDMRNILARTSNQHVVVQCRKCDEFVARYQIAPGGYFHNGKDYESFLRTMMLDSGFTSGRDLRAVFEEVSESATATFEHATRKAKEKYGEELP